jgi:hypothetical protein
MRTVAVALGVTAGAVVCVAGIAIAYITGHDRGESGALAKLPIPECPRCAECRDCAPAPTNPLALTDEGDARLRFVVQKAREFRDHDTELSWVPLPPDMSTLGIVFRPVCNDRTLADMARNVDEFRRRGFLRIVCYPEMEFGFDVPPEGTSVTIEKPGAGTGWACVPAGSVPSEVALCIRDRGVCRELARKSAHGPCFERSVAFCAASNGETVCWSAVEACSALRDVGGPECAETR